MAEQVATLNPSEPAPVLPLVDRLASYTVINSLYLTYDSVKQYNPLIKFGLETAESLSTQVFTKLDATLGLEERGAQVLDKIEDQVVVAAKMYSDGADYVSQTKEKAVTKGKELVVDANRQANQLLDITEKLVDQLLPPSMEIQEVENLGGEPERDAQDPARLDANPIPRVTAIGYAVPQRLKAVALSKLSTLDLRSQTQVESFSYVVDLIQYAADYIDVDKQKQALLNASESVRERVGANIDTVNQNFVSPIKDIVDRHTGDIKNAGLKTVVGVVATIAQAVEVARRQVLNHFGSRQKLQDELVNYTISAKQAILSLKDHDLIDYINLVKTNSHQALTKIIELVNTYVPAQLLERVPGLESLEEGILVWRDSINQRLSAALEDISTKKQTTD